MENDRIDRDDAAAQLAALQADRAALADRVLQPWWYDVSLGLLLFGFLASYAFDSLWVTFPALVVFGAGLGALVTAYRRITGVRVNTGGLRRRAPGGAMTAGVPASGGEGWSVDRDAAAAQPDVLRADQATLADRIVQPWWWDAAGVGPVEDRVQRAVRSCAIACCGLLTLGGAAEFLLDVPAAMVVVGAVLGVSVALLGRWVTRVHAAGLRADR